MLYVYQRQIFIACVRACPTCRSGPTMNSGHRDSNPDPWLCLGSTSPGLIVSSCKKTPQTAAVDLWSAAEVWPEPTSIAACQWHKSRFGFRTPSQELLALTCGSVASLMLEGDSGGWLIVSSALCLLCFAPLLYHSVLCLVVLHSFFYLCCVGVKLGLSHWGRNIDWGCSRIWCWGGYLGLRGTG